MAKRFPVNKQGFIDEKMLYKIVYVTLKLPLGSLDDLIAEEIEWLLQGYQEEQKQFYEMLAYSFRAGYISANNGKPIQLFEDGSKKNESKKITKSQKENELEALKNLFE
ncbi:MAG: hypothetical protein WBA84_04005 [Carnobacterium sp.]|uniref:hypothetical protein n=1 Tax=Carnobacterium sp. TaxID=48221 RepID=UPI003C78DE9A